VLLARDAFYAADARSIQARADDLADRLMEVLNRWGLNRQLPSLPSLRNKPAIARCLIALRDRLRKLAALSTYPPRLHDGERFVPRMLYTPDELDQEVLSLLIALADGLFVCCSHATYLLKSLLLLTGYTVALDRNVRKGARLAGLEGMNEALPTENIRASAITDTSLQIVTLPYLVGTAWHAEPEFFDDLIAVVGRHPELVVVGSPASPSGASVRHSVFCSRQIWAHIAAM